MEEHELPLPRALLRGLGYLLQRASSFSQGVEFLSLLLAAVCGLGKTANSLVYGVGARWVLPAPPVAGRRSICLHRVRAPSSRQPSSVVLLVPSGRITPSTLGQWDQPYGSLDVIQNSVARKARGGGRAAPGPGQIEFWRQKVKVQLDKTVMSASYEELDDMVLSHPLR